MLLAKIKEKLFNRRNKVEVEDVEVKGEIPASIKALIESLSGTSIKEGYFIFNDITHTYEWVEAMPEDYNGVYLYFSGDSTEMFEVGSVNAGQLLYTDFHTNGVHIYSTNDEEITYESNGETKLRITHSFI